MSPQQLADLEREIAEKLGPRRQALARKLARHPEVRERHLGDSLSVTPTTIAEKFLHWTCPWQMTTFPGRHRVWERLTDNRVSRKAIEHWRTGRQPVPLWACDLWIARARSDFERVARIVSGLEEYREAERARRAATVSPIERYNAKRGPGLGARGRQRVVTDVDTTTGAGEAPAGGGGGGGV